MAFGIRLWDPIEDLFTENEKKPRRGSTAAYRPSRLYDVPIPPKKKPKVTKEIAKRKEERRQRPSSISIGKMGFTLPSLGPTRAAVGDVIELGAGAIPAAKTAGGIFKRDAEKVWKQRGLRAPTRSTLDQYWELAKWMTTDERDDPRAKPKTESEIVGFLAEMTRKWVAGVEKAVPEPWVKGDVEKAKKAWGDDPLFALMDVVPMAAAVTRPASIARQMARIEQANKISKRKALAAGAKESYRPGSAARAGLAGGIDTRMLRAEVGEVQGRPWSRTPLMRTFQRKYDQVWESNAATANYRVGRAQGRRETEDERRQRLEMDELQRPIAKLIYGPIGRAAASFGMKKNMTPKERRVATALMYRFQMPTHLAHTEALATVQADLTQILQAGKIEVPKGDGRRQREIPLTEEQKQNISQQLVDLDLARKDFDNGKIDMDEFDEGLSSLKEIADRSQDLGLEILERVKRLDPDAVEEMRSIWDARSRVLPRRLANRGHLPHRDLADSPERSAWLQILTNRWGEEKARFVIAATDARALGARPQDPASFYTERVGNPTEESAQAFVDRVGDDAFFQLEEVVLGPEGSRHRRAGVRRTVEGAEPDTDIEYNPLEQANYFYSPLQRWIDEQWPPDAEMKRMKVQSLRKRIRSQIPDEEYYNAGLDLLFETKHPEYRMPREELMEHLRSPMNAYDLEEHYFISNELGRSMHQNPTEMGTTYDAYMDGAVISRDPTEIGQYREIVMRLPTLSRRPGYDDSAYHWGDTENVVGHIRFQVFEEDGVRKLLIEEIQSDWESDARAHPGQELTDEEHFETDIAHNKFLDTRRDAEDAYRESQDWHRRVVQLDREFNRKREKHQRLLHPPKRKALADEIFETQRSLEIAKQRLAVAKAEYDRLNDAMDQRHREWLDLAGREGTAPSPLGATYYRAMIRRIMREAVEENVDEIVIVDPTTQFHRTSTGHPMLKGRGEEADGFDPDQLRKWVKERERAKSMPERELESLKTWRQLLESTYPDFLEKEYGLVRQYRDDAYQGRYSAEGNMDISGDQWAGSYSRQGDMPGLVFKVTDEARQKAKAPQRLYQRQPDWKALPKGAVELLDGNTLMHLFEKGDVTTWIHELGHVSLYDLAGPDRTLIEEFFAGGKAVEAWKRSEHENFARVFERYFAKGVAPNPELASVFAKIAAWMRSVWKEAKQRLPQGRLTPEVAEVFDRMFAKVPEHGDGMQPYGYFPHRDMYEMPQEFYKGGTRPAARGQVIGVPPLTRQAIERDKNELILYQTGRLNPDPRALVDVYLKRLQFQRTLDIREHLYDDVGREISEGVPDGAWLVRDPREPPEKLTARLQGAVRGQELRRPNEPELENALSIDPEDFRREVIARASEKPKWKEDPENVRWVPGEYISSLFPEVFASAPRGKLTSSARMLTSAQRATGIYGRPLAYIGGNIPFNVTALMATMPLGNLRSAQQAIRLKKRDPELYRALSSEAGQARAEAGLPGVSYLKPQGQLQRTEQGVTKFQRGMADLLSGVADDPFRVTAMLTNARKRGYSSDDELWNLVRHNGTDMADVRQLTREQLLDFDALNPINRKLAENLLYLWPFMYAATKWPFMFAREYPGRAGLAAQAIEEEPERLLPNEVANFWKSKGIDLQAVNPLGPAGDIAEDLDLFLKDPGSLDLTVLKERLSPTIDLLVEGMGGGKKNALKNFARGTVPGVSEAAAFAGEDWRGSKMYGDREEPWPYLLTRHTRYWPRELNEEKMKETIEQAARDKITTAVIDRDRDADQKKIAKYAKEMGGIDYVEEVERSHNAWWEYQEGLAEKKDSTGQRKLSPIQQVEVLDPVVREHFPELADQLSPLDAVKESDEPAKVEEYVTALREIINEGRSMLFDDYRSYVAP